MRAASFIAGALLVSILIGSAGHLLAYANIVNTWWIRDFFTYQNYLASTERTKPRLYVLAGSNGLLGFDGALLEKYTQYRPINFTTHVAMDLDLLTKRVEPYLRPGDAILLPLEPHYYQRKVISDFEQRQYLTWMQDEFSILGAWDSFQHNMKTPLEMLLSLSWARLKDGRKQLELLDGPQIVQRLEDIRQGKRQLIEVTYEKEYDQERADRWGFIYRLHHSERYAHIFVEKNWGYPKLHYDTMTPYSRKTIANLEQLARERNVTLLYSWPAMISNDRHNRDDQKLLAMYRKFGDDMRARGHNFVCDPEDYIFHVNYFWDTHFHLNALGASLRTLSLLRCMKEQGLSTLSDAVPPAHPASIKDMVLLSRYRDARKAELFEFEHVLRNMQALADGLKREKQAERGYPVAQHWQRAFSNQTLPAAWTESLAGPQLRSFPANLVKRRGGPPHILYKSDGKDFKIIATKTADCEYVLDMLPAAADPKRECTLAIWTPGANTW